MCYFLGARVKNDCIKDCIKMETIFKKNHVLCLHVCFHLYFPTDRPLSLNQCSYMWQQLWPDSARKNGMNCPFLPRAVLFLITLMPKWQHYYYAGQLLQLAKIWTSASLSKSFPSSICQPLSSLLVFSFVSHSTQHNVSLIHYIYGIQIQPLYFKRG